MSTVSSSLPVTVTVNGVEYEREVEARKLLIHLVRDDLDLTGSHIGCDTGNCGACSMIVNGQLVKSCMMLAVQVDGATIETLMSATALLRAQPSPTDEQIRRALQGNICRCTGYWNIFEAVKAAAS
jgi:aerobic-type carbon monoxide dehydrogenase small subunit (CoxS/CutS family)